jgi:hypothetical protein
MASARQIAANCRNAQKSTGPRSEEGKKRASRNACRHGLAAGVRHAGTFAVQIEALAHAIAGAATGSLMAAADAEILAFARTAAQAEVDLARIRRAKGAIMNSLEGAAHSQIAVSAPGDEFRHCVATPQSGEPSFEPSRVLPSTPSPERKRLAETMRTLLTDLLKLDRYERRATGRRDRAVAQIVSNKLFATIKSCDRQNEPNLSSPKTWLSCHWE